jgi:hypothetical protein
MNQVNPTKKLGVLALLGLSVLTLSQLERLPSDGGPTEGPAVSTATTTSSGGSSDLATRHLDRGTTAARAEASDPTWIAGQLMVAPAPGASLEAIAARHGARVLRAAGRSGIGALSLPGPHTAAALQADPEVGSVAPMGRTHAAGTVTDAQSALSLAQAELSLAEAELASLDAELEEAEEILALAESDVDEALANSASASVVAELEAIEAEAQTLLAQVEEAWETAQDTVDAAQATLNAAEGAVTAAVSSAADLQWHLPHSRHPDWDSATGPDPAAGAGVVVAVLDSGVALDSSGAPAATSLAGHSFVSAIDIVDGDSLPEDGHQHGTHIASIIAGQGGAWGIAPGVTLMPVRVLDDDNAGTELDLVEGLWHAIDNGAQVINLSLTFGPEYVPSSAMSAALRAARDAGIVVVGAAGNDAGTSALWPAASPHVIAVGATTLDGKPSKKGTPTDYTNTGLAIEIMAAGGDLDEDADDNGIVDGIIGETFDPSQPSSFGMWAYAGTSQSAAVVSGAAALLLASGADAAEARALLQEGARGLPGNCWKNGCGAGAVDIGESIELIGDTDVDEVAPVYASVLPWIKRKGSSSARPRFEVAVIDEDGAPIADAKVYATAWSDSEAAEAVSCTTDSDGLCSIKPWATMSQSDANDGTFALRVDMVKPDDTGLAPTPVLFATDALALIQGALAADADLEDAVLGIAWPEGTDAYLGKTMASYAVVDWGTGLASSPLGVVLGPGALPDGSTVTTDTLDIDGTGLASSPLGVLPISVLGISGTGLASSPLGLVGITQLDIALVDGSGLASSPLGFTAVDVALPGGLISGTGLASSPLGYTGEPVLLDEQLALGLGDDDPLQQALSGGSFLGSLPMGGATALMGASTVGSSAVEGGELDEPVLIAD